MSLFNYREKPGYFKRLTEALSTTKEDLSHKIGRIAGTGKSPISEVQLEDLEEVLMGADIGVQTSIEIVERVKEETQGDRFVTSQRLQRTIRKELLRILEGSINHRETSSGHRSPAVVFVVGVNGVGKTTTIGKLAYVYKEEGKSVIFSASDTFRAAAIEQIEVWAERVGCEVIRQKPGADPAAVLFDAISAAKARKMDALIVDTAGRLHTKSNLMQELEKMNRVAAREIQGAPHEVFLVLDATTGHNGLMQAREFLKTAGVTGLIVTKLDGTAKGGIVISIVNELGIPIRYIGVGEKIGDFLPFDAEAYVETLI